MDHRYIEEENIADKYLMGRLSASERSEFEVHFMDCALCVETIEETAALMRGLAAAEAPDRVQEKARGPAPLLSLFAGLTPMWKVVLPSAFALLILIPAVYLVIENRRLSHALEQARMISAPSQETARDRQAESLETSGPVQGAGASGGAPDQQRVSPGSLPSGENALEASLPRVNTPIFVLSALRGVVRHSNDIVIDSSDGWFVISLELENKPQYKTYRATISSSPDGRVLWVANDLFPDKYDELTMGFGAAFFPPGNYRITLEGISPSAPPRPVAVFPCRIIKKH